MTRLAAASTAGTPSAALIFSFRKRRTEPMKTSSLLTLAILLAVALAAPLAHADDADVVGVWDTVAETPEGNMSGVLTITKTEGGLEVTLELASVDRTVSDVALEGQTLEMTVTYEGSPYDVELEVDGDTMTGTYSGMQAAGPMKAQRRP
jgi:hypothetical protein